MSQKKIRLRHLKRGLLRDTLDERDFIFSSSLKIFPVKVDHTSEMSPVKNQGSLGSCVAFSASALKEWQEIKEHLQEVEGGKRDYRQGKHYDFSEQWIYYMCKKIDGNSSEGTSFRSAMKVLSKIGVPAERAWPYNAKAKGKPKRWAHLVSRWALIGEYRRIYGLEELKKALIESPVLIGIPLTTEIFGKLVNGVIPYPKNPDKLYGGHAVCAVGYDDEKQLIKFKNSWSKFWGDRGYGYLSYNFIRDFLWAAWICKDIVVTKEMLKNTKELLDG